MRHSKINRKYGCRVDLRDHRDIGYKMAVCPKEVSLPPSVSLEHLLPACWDQGQEGSCTGHGVGAAHIFIHPGRMPSRNMIYANGRELEGDVDQDNGAQIHDVVQALAKYGACEESLWPYEDQTLLVLPPEDCYATGLPYTISTYMRVSDLEDTKSCLSEGFPVIIGFSVFDNFENDLMAQTGELHLPGPEDSPLGGHCVLVTGYDDSLQQVRVRNSWGTSWGQNGNFWMDYSYFNNLVSDMWTIRK